MNLNSNLVTHPILPNSPPFQNIGSSLPHFSNSFVKSFLNNLYFHYVSTLHKDELHSLAETSHLSPETAASESFFPQIIGRNNPSTTNPAFYEGEVARLDLEDTSQESLVCGLMQNFGMNQFPKENEMMLNQKRSQESHIEEILKREETQGAWKKTSQVKQEEVRETKQDGEKMKELMWKNNEGKRTTVTTTVTTVSPVIRFATEVDSFWNDERDRLLLDLAMQCRNDWKKIFKKISKKFPNKALTPNFLKQRYKKLKSTCSQKRTKFTHEEDLKIVEMFNLYGAVWDQIATHFQNRTGPMLKNRYYSNLKKLNRFDSLLAEIQNNERNEKNDRNEELEEAIPVLLQQQHEEPGMSNPVENELHEKVTLVLCPKEGFSIGVPTVEGNSITIQIFKEKLNREARLDSSNRESEEVKALRERVKSLQALCVTMSKLLKKQKNASLNLRA